MSMTAKDKAREIEAAYGKLLLEKWEFVWDTPNVLSDMIAKALRAHANAALEAAAEEIRDFQDMVGWQKYDSRNQLIQDVEDKVRALKEK